MNKTLITLCLATLLTACASKGMKDTDMSSSNTESQAAAMIAKSSGSAETPVSTDAGTAATSYGPVPTPSMSPFTDPNNILSQRTVYFDLDQYTVKSQYTAALQAHAKYLSSHPTASVIIKGNADERGSHEYNLALGQKRASSVKRALNLYGVSDSQIETVSYGEEYPLEPGMGEHAWSKNRRAEIDYISE